MWRNTEYKWKSACILIWYNIWLELPHKVIEQIPGFPFMSYAFRWPLTKREDYTKKSNGKFHASRVPKQSSIILLTFKSWLKTSMEIVNVCYPFETKLKWKPAQNIELK